MKVDPHANDVTPVNVLLVDDRPENLLALQAIIRSRDVRVVLANSGEEALRALAQDDFALILLDVAMPGMDGFETAERIQALPRGQSVPIIFITASLHDTAQTHRGYALGAVDYLYKPLSTMVVRAKVAVFIELYRQREQLRRQSILLQETARREREGLMVRAEEALNASEAQYEATARQAPFGVAILGHDGNWLRINPRLLDMIGYDRQSLPPLRALLHPHQAPSDAHGVEQVLRGITNAFRGELRLVNNAGYDVWVSMALSRLSDEEESRIAVILEDITERKWMEQCQRFLNQASKMLLSSLDFHDTLPAVAALAIPSFADWCAIDIVPNQGSHARELVLMHRTPERLDDVRVLRRALWWDAQHRCPRIPVEPELMSVVSAKIVEAQRDRHAPAPQRLPASWLCVPITAHGNVLGAITFASEGHHHYHVADLLTAEDFANRCAFAVENTHLYEEAQAAIRARDEFLSVASHELRTPLTPLRIQLQRLIGTRHRPPANLSNERTREILQRSERHVQRLAALIDNLLDVSRITSGRLTVDVETMDLAALTRDVASRFSDELAASGCQFNLATTPVIGRWDRSRLDQVITNLLTNAIKYGKGKPIDVAVRACDGVAQLLVRDHGIGIAADKQAHIFERFERAVPARVYGGLGLGLFIARQILHAHGGTIRVTSEPGEGALFTVELPMCTVADAKSDMYHHDTAEHTLRPEDQHLP